jgi:ubiquinone/menaquinone biosynthesis C-methylase UbiE
MRASEDKDNLATHRLHAALDPEGILLGIGVKEGTVVFDAGSGEGRFALPAASIVGSQGRVYAADTSKERIATLRRAAETQDLDQIEAFVADVTEKVPLPGTIADVCLVANVLHGFVEDGTILGALREIRRLLKPEGVLAVLEFKKDVERPPGPPLSIRLSPDELEALLRKHGFELKSTTEVGSFHYLSLFSPATAEA